MADDDKESAEKKHQPTRLRLRKAREQGNVAKSKDLTSAVVLLAWILAFTLGARFLIEAWERRTVHILDAASRPTVEVLLQNLWSCSALTFVSVTALLAPVAVIGLLAQFAQVGPVFVLSKAGLDFSRLDPAIWAKRLVNSEAAVELLKSIAKQAMVVVIGCMVFGSVLPWILRLSNTTPKLILPALGKVFLPLFGAAAALGLVIGALDLLYQRYIYLRNMRMTVFEFRRDLKFLQGDPKIKGMRKRFYREWANHNAAEATRGAAVVVTNPTHYAVALAYDPADHAAPVVAAKGQDEMAAEIRRAAEGAAVPMIRNPPLARELHERLEIDETVPEDLFVVVAEVIVWASRLRQESQESRESQDAGEAGDEEAISPD